MSMTLDEFLAADPHELALRLKKKRPKPEKPKAEVIPLPTGQSLAVVKSEWTRVAEIDRAPQALASSWPASSSTAPHAQRSA